MNILMISPFFAPFTGVAGLRMTSLAKYLLKQGECLTVVKAKDSCYPAAMANGPHIPGITYVEFDMQASPQKNILALRSHLDILCRDHQFDCCLVSCGPYYTLQVALALKNTYELPFVIDYRDLWIYDARIPKTAVQFLLRARLRLWEYRVEKRVMAECSAFITCTSLSLQTMLKHYPNILGKAYCVYNGYEHFTLDKSDIELSSQQNKIEIYILGKFSYYTSHGATVFLRAVNHLLKKGYPIYITRIGVPEDLQPLFAKTAFPQDHFTDLGPLPYEKALSLAQSAHICTAIISYKIGLGTKLFDYIYLNRPIVAYAPKQSEFESVLSEAENAYVCQTSDEMAQAIEKIILGKRYVLTEDPSYRDHFSREHQNETFHQILRTVGTVENGI